MKLHWVFTNRFFLTKLKQFWSIFILQRTKWTTNHWWTWKSNLMSLGRWVVGHLQLLHGEVLCWRIRPHIPLPAELGGCCLGSAEAGYRNRWLFQARASPAASYFLLLRVVLVQHVPPSSKKSTFKEHGEHTSYAITYHVTNVERIFYCCL